MIYQDYLDGKGCRPIWRNPKTYTAGTQIIMGVDNNNTCQVTYTATNSNTASDLRIQIWQLGASNFANSLSTHVESFQNTAAERCCPFSAGTATLRTQCSPDK